MTENNRAGRWNIKELVERNSSEHGYRDWEGFADAITVAEMVHKSGAADVLRLHKPEVVNATLDIVANLVFESIDQVGEKWAKPWIIYAAIAVAEVLTTRQWTKSGIDWNGDVAGQLNWLRRTRKPRRTK